LSSTSSSNPSVLLTTNPSAIYTLTVTDSSGAKSTATVYVGYYAYWYTNTGADQSYCGGTAASVNLGAGNPIASGLTYAWSPPAGLATPTSPSPIATPTVTTTYTMTATQSTCAPKVQTVTITVHSPPPVKAGPWIVINEGEKTTLHGSGAVIYLWIPSSTILYNGTATPDAEPTTTTTYTVEAKDQYGCVSSDTVTVFVNKENGVIIYNTFTPNGDGNNDVWYIGNISKFPANQLDIYNRYGKLIYSKKGYVNDWDGTNFGEKLPEATYYYILNLNDGSSPYKGSVSIIR
jgi:gliding motility-associated-like protein